MKERRTILNTIAVLTFSTMLMAVQMQTPASTPASGKPAGSSAASKTLTGIVSDSMCGATHMAKDKSPAECTRICAKQGTKYALVVGKKVYTLEGQEADLDKLAGTKATVKGNVMGEMLMVESVAAAKKVVGAGETTARPPHVVSESFPRFPSCWGAMRRHCDGGSRVPAWRTSEPCGGEADVQSFLTF